mgnify:CR=1 FL=1
MNSAGNVNYHVSSPSEAMCRIIVRGNFTLKSSKIMTSEDLYSTSENIKSKFH